MKVTLIKPRLSPLAIAAIIAFGTPALAQDSTEPAAEAPAETTASEAAAPDAAAPKPQPRRHRLKQHKTARIWAPK